MYRLCICIPTLNRAAFIGQTLDSIVAQLREGVGIVIVDGGSSDGTGAIVADYVKRHPAIRYIVRDGGGGPSNAGFDRDCAYAVELADAEYCWLMTDDDILLPGAIDAVLERLRGGHDLVVASAQVRDVQLETILIPARPELAADVVLVPSQWDQFVRAAMVHLTFVGAVVVKRAVWMERDAARFFGTGFVHVGVIFSEPPRGTVAIIAEPLVLIRYGNAQWLARGFEIFMFRWPELVWSFPGISDEAKRSITLREPWRSWRVLLLQRAYGRYSQREYRTLLRDRLATGVPRMVPWAISIVPKFLLYGPAWLYGRLFHRHPRYFISTLDEGLGR
jgi:glycosyltransferase involved in cell wall biosynthesis